MDSRGNRIHITLQGTNLSITPELRQFVDKKIEDAVRALGEVNPDAVRIEIELEHTSRRHPQERKDEQLFRAEANVKVPGRLIRVEESAMHIEQAIVKMKNTLTRQIRHWRERTIEHKRKGGRRAKSMGEQPAPAPDSIADEWDEPTQETAPSPYQDIIDEEEALQKGPDIWSGTREDDERDFV